AERDQDVRPEAGAFPAQFALGADRAADHGREQQSLDELHVRQRLVHDCGTRFALNIISGGPMLWTIVVLLLILWLLGFTLHVTGGLIHVLLVIALVVIVLQLLTGRRV